MISNWNAVFQPKFDVFLNKWFSLICWFEIFTSALPIVAFYYKSLSLIYDKSW